MAWATPSFAQLCTTATKSCESINLWFTVVD